MAKKAPARFEFPRLIWAVIESDGGEQYASFYTSIEDLPDDQNGGRVMVFCADQEYELKIGKVLV